METISKDRKRDLVQPRSLLQRLEGGYKSLYISMHWKTKIWKVWYPCHMVDDLNISLQHGGNRDTVVIYFFCSHDWPERLKADTVLRFLVRQLLNPLPDLKKFARQLDRTKWDRELETILKIAQDFLPRTCNVYFLLDGLDEIEPKVREKLFSYLQGLQKSAQEMFPLLLCVSVRLEPNNTLRSWPGNVDAISIPEDNPDIKLYIDDELERCIESGKLVIGNPTLILEIQQALYQKAQGMFLWVAIQIKLLCSMKIDHTIKEALLDLLRDLSETFSRVWLCISEWSHGHCGAHRPKNWWWLLEYREEAGPPHSIR